MSWLLLQGWLLIFNVLGTTKSYVSCRVVVLTALCVVMAVYAATARTTYAALTVVVYSGPGVMDKFMNMS